MVEGVLVGPVQARWPNPARAVGAAAVVVDTDLHTAVVAVVAAAVESFPQAAY